MLVFADGRTVGTIGGGCYENDAFWKAREAIASGRPALLHYRAERRLRPGERADLRRTDGRPHRSAGAGAAPLHHRRRPRRIASRARRPASRASASTSSTTARSSPTASAFPGADVVVEPIPEWLHRVGTSRVRVTSSIVTRGHQTRSRRDARAGRARSALPRSDRQPGQGGAHLRRAARRRHAGRVPRSASTPRSAWTSAP